MSLRTRDIQGELRLYSHEEMLKMLVQVNNHCTGGIPEKPLYNLFVSLMGKEFGIPSENYLEGVNRMTITHMVDVFVRLIQNEIWFSIGNRWAFERKKNIDFEPIRGKLDVCSLTDFQLLDVQLHDPKEYLEYPTMASGVMGILLEQEIWSSSLVPNVKHIYFSLRKKIYLEMAKRLQDQIGLKIIH